MFIFIDESGVHAGDKSTVALVYVMVENIEALNEGVCKMEKELKIEYFHWSKYSWKIRREFIQGLSRQQVLKLK